MWKFGKNRFFLSLNGLKIISLHRFFETSITSKQQNNDKSRYR